MIITKTSEAVNAYHKLDVMLSALSEIDGKLHTMKELAILAASDMETDEDRASLDEEFQALKREIEEISLLARSDINFV